METPVERRRDREYTVFEKPCRDGPGKVEESPPGERRILRQRNGNGRQQTVYAQAPTLFSKESADQLMA